ncbi:cytochrome-c oxidase, cbb3-type subunit III [Helicobacter sp. 11S02629-2]|uniref:cytochrome-c oxidase, cbb3-type subunit III n=1 Tax=Helicobacter sp. 11S02629-2 TaxID=1476195 RepID=UPI000BA7D0DC|nr:cytochrome-c oxidase, cbb3-type subunit III [Helicobacter sp. 11S02629-2]PAF45354.1 cytochrome-c oxidase, cbb3-type subunit III [Helicobacter sp. 11S02629-2]
MGWLSDHINLMSFIAAIVILVLTIVISGFYIKQMKTSKAEGELGEHSWDGIREFNNNIPTGWLLSLFILILWALWYIFFGYPLNSYSQIGEYNQEVRDYNARFAELHKNMTTSQFEEMGQEIFLVQCASCHGLTAEGIDGKAQNLTRWGKVEGIMDTITHGSKGLGFMAGEMPAGLLSKESDKRAVAEYVMSDLVKDTSTKYDLALVAQGKQIFASACAACHGVDGKGDGGGVAGFAADLTQYGKFAFLQHVLTHGKHGEIGKMPSFQYLNFSDVQIKALDAFIASKRPLE